MKMYISKKVNKNTCYVLLKDMFNTLKHVNDVLNKMDQDIDIVIFDNFVYVGEKSPNRFFLVTRIEGKLDHMKMSFLINPTAEILNIAEKTLLSHPEVIINSSATLSYKKKALNNECYP